MTASSTTPDADQLRQFSFHVFMKLEGAITARLPAFW